MQLLLPTLFFTSKVYSPLSSSVALRILSPDTLLKKLILYLWSVDSSLPSLNHLAVSSGVPSTVHSRVQESPAVTLTGPGFSTMTAGSAMKFKSEKVLEQ